MSDKSREKAVALVQKGTNLKNKGSNRHGQFNEMDFFFGFQTNDEFRTFDGGRINRQLFVTEARQMIIDFAAGLHSNLTPQLQDWIFIEPKERDKGDRDKAAWTDIAQSVIREIINESNFNEQIHEWFIELGKFNTACLYSEYDPETVIRFRTRRIRDIYISENARGEVDTVFLYMSMTAKQIKQLWGDKTPGRVMSSLEQGNTEDEYKIIHVVEPRQDADPKKLGPLSMPWASYYIFEEEPDIIEEGGYKELPYHIARFYKEDGDSYGIGPSFYLLPAVRQLDYYKVKQAENVDITLSPPILLPHDDYIMPDEIGPRSVIIGDDSSSGQPVRKLDIGGDYRLGEAAIERELANLRKGFFIDHMQVLTGITKEMTARETAELIAESTRYLGPVIWRLNKAIEKMLQRTLRMAIEEGKIPPPPPDMTDYTFRFDSFLTRAQRASQLAELDAWTQRIGLIGQVDPSAYDNINIDQIVRGTGEIHGIEQRYINPIEQVQQTRQQRAQQAAQQAQLEQLAMLNQGGGPSV